MSRVGTGSDKKSNWPDRTGFLPIHHYKIVAYICEFSLPKTNFIRHFQVEGMCEVLLGIRNKKKEDAQGYLCELAYRERFDRNGSGF